MISIEPPLEQQDWWGELARGKRAEVEKEAGPVVVAHVVSDYACYPGETITLYTRVEVREETKNLSLRVSVPEGVIVGDYRPPAQLGELMPVLEIDSLGMTHLAWSPAERLLAGTSYEFQTEVKIAPTPENLSLTSRAVVTAANLDLPVAESVTIAVRAKGQYLKHLPSLYERDELMGRFLMLFESFWAPITQQIEVTHHYFDPRITPADFLAWLAGWLDLELDERWPEARQRQLIRWAIALHRSRGTKWGLLKYLEIYTGQKAEIVERRARNFVLGPDARLGPGIALGQGNRPHTFTVNLRLPPIEADSKKERERLEEIRRRTIESIIEMQKPAHTVYALNLEPLETTQPSAGAEARLKKSDQDDEIAAQAAIWFKLDE